MTRSRMEYILRYCSIEELRKRWLHYMQHVELRSRSDPRVANTKENADKFPDCPEMRRQIIDRLYGESVQGLQGAEPHASAQA